MRCKVVHVKIFRMTFRIKFTIGLIANCILKSTFMKSNPDCPRVLFLQYECVFVTPSVLEVELYTCCVHDVSYFSSSSAVDMTLCESFFRNILFS